MPFIRPSKCAASPMLTLELRLLARMMGDLRTGFEQIGLRLRHWHGAGAAASALIETQKLKMHYGPDVAASNISPQQTAAHHAYFGGRIELLKAGFLRRRQLARLRHCLRIPGGDDRVSQPRGREWTRKSGAEIPTGSLRQLRAAIEAASIVSMFKIRFQFPTYERYDADARKAVFIPFYPLPYRDKRGGILFPASGYGWYMRDDVLAAIAWLERFVPDYPRPRNKHHRMTAFEIEETWIFEPGQDGRANERPFEFVRDLFLKRRQIKDEADRVGRYDIREKTIKLALNSIYGKLAQSVGGDGKAPSVANPYYAAATTAYCRRRLIEAALHRSACDRLLRHRWHRLNTPFDRARPRQEGGRRCRTGRLGIQRGGWRSLRHARRLHLRQSRLSMRPAREPSSR